MEGNIMVDGVLASCYACPNHDLCHIAMIPNRWFPVIAKWILGEEDNSSAYVPIVSMASRWMHVWEFANNYN